MTREEAFNILSELVERVNGTPDLHRQLWQAIAVLNEPASSDEPAFPHTS